VKTERTGDGATEIESRMSPTPPLTVQATADPISLPPETDSYPPAGYAWYVVGVLTLAYIFSFIDRQILSLMVVPIQQDLGINDKQMGLLMGLSFAVFYTLFGIPLGRLADTRSRRVIISVGIALWSVMTAGCGLARTFWQLAVMRMGVGVGEASLSPSAYSLISDYFRPERRSTAMSVYSMGIYIGSGLAFILGGFIMQLVAGQESTILPWIGPVRSWQLVFFAVGIPGLLVSLLLLTVREPVRRGVRLKPDGSTITGPTSGAVWFYIRTNYLTFMFLTLGTGMIALYSYGANSWIPAMLIRRYGWSQAKTGQVFGIIVAIAGTLGIVSGGRLADWLRPRGYADANLRVALWGAIAGVPFVLLFPLAPSANLVAGLLVPVVFFMSMPFGVAPAAIQQMMPNTMRAQATAFYLFVINLLGIGLGPWIVALLTEDVFHDKQAVHLSLLVVGAVSFALAILALWAGLKPYRRSLDYLKQFIETDERQAQ
jgi:MFS family permease